MAMDSSSGWAWNATRVAIRSGRYRAPGGYSQLERPAGEGAVGGQRGVGGRQRLRVAVHLVEQRALEQVAHRRRLEGLVVGGGGHVGDQPGGLAGQPGAGGGARADGELGGG